jgi:hypothetical protein
MSAEVLIQLTVSYYLLIHIRNQLKPLSQRVTQNTWESINITENQIKRKWKTVEVGGETDALRSTEQRLLNVQNGILKHIQLRTDIMQ